MIEIDSLLRADLSFLDSTCRLLNISFYRRVDLQGSNPIEAVQLFKEKATKMVITTLPALLLVAITVSTADQGQIFC